MNDFKTRFNPLYALWLLAVATVYGSLFYSMYRSDRHSQATEFNRYVTIAITIIVFAAIFILAMKPYFKRAKNYLIQDRSIEEFNVLTFTTKSIDKDDVKGFSTSKYGQGILKFKEIIIYMKDGSKANMMQFVYLNFKDIEPTLLDKKYNYLGDEPYDTEFFKSRIYKYDDKKINSDFDNTAENIGRGAKAKIKLVFVPYLIITLATVIGWTYLHWLVFIKHNLYQVDERVLVIAVPLLLSVASIAIWLYKKIRMFRIKDKRLALYFMVPFLTMVGMNSFVQQCIIVATGKMTELSSISQIEQKEPSKFYTLKNFYLDKKHFSIKKQFSGSGKHGSDLNMNIYITIPVLNSAKDTLGSNCVGWYGFKFNDTARGFVSEHASFSLEYDYRDISTDTIENSEEVKRFVNESMKNFDNLNLNQFLYLERITKMEREYKDYVSAIKDNTKYDTKSDVVLLPSNESIAHRANYNLLVALAIFAGGSLIFLIIVINTKLKWEEEG